VPAGWGHPPLESLWRHLKHFGWCQTLPTSVLALPFSPQLTRLWPSTMACMGCVPSVSPTPSTVHHRGLSWWPPALFCTHPPLHLFHCTGHKL
jgi:hypothetical protein